MKQSSKYVLLLLMLLACTSGCGKKPEDMRKDLAFTVCARTQLPDELIQIIEEKKIEPFTVSYQNQEHTYIAVGYGAHDRTNLSVVVEELYQTDRAIYIKTNLHAVEATDTDAQAKGDASMYPYIVLKLDKIDLPIIYE